MTMETKNNVFKEHKIEYFKAGKLRKGEILKSVCILTKMHRKAVIRRFKTLQMKDSSIEEKRGRHEFYTPDVTVALKEIWEVGDMVCGELLYPIIKEYVDILIRDKVWHHSDEATDKLLFMSEATVKRRVGKFIKARRRKKGLSLTKPSHIKHLVPIFIGPWTDKPPGYGQVDTVVHSSSATGDYAYTVNWTDAATLATFPRAQWNKGMTATRDSLEHIYQKMNGQYFPMLGNHPDTGAEFINEEVIKWNKEKKVDFSRSRPSHSNDNMHIEERNGHVIRKHVGYITLNCPPVVDLLNDFYDILTPYLFHFIAIRRMIEKEKLSSRYRRVYEKTAKTPYQRTLEHPNVAEKVKEKLSAIHAKLSPLVLKQEMDRRIKRVYDVQQKHGRPR